MFLVYLVVGFPLRYGLVTTNGLAFSEADAVVFVGWNGLLFRLINIPPSTFVMILRLHAITG
jgi:hypothetical protein